jgi:putative PIN family toxin of toxin-antitoxin system
MKVVVDVNVLISALLWGGTPRKILILAQNNQISIFASPDLFQELENTLKRTKFQAKIKSLGLTVEDILDAATEVLQSCSNISLNVDISQLRDMKDYHILAAAVSAQANFLITGDQDLLVLNQFAEILIMTPADFLNTYFTSS